MRTVAAIILGTLGDIRETLPSDEQEAACWLSGFCWAFAIFIVILLGVTAAWARAHGVSL
jgi:hypothetical protein